MTAAIRVGSQLFINKDDTPDQVREWVRKINDSGLEIIRLFMHWDHLEPREYEWDFSLYDACFDEAAKFGIGIVPTLMSVSPPGWMRLTDRAQAVADLDEPGYQERSAVYIRRLVEHYKDAPNLDSWILWNEPCRGVPRGDNSLRLYSQFLQQRYGTVENMNRNLFKQYTSFDEIAFHRNANGAYTTPFGDYVEQLNWARFSVENLTQHLLFIQGEIRKIDSQHPVHVNPHALQSDMQRIGQSIWKQRQLVDFIGCSAHPPWHSMRFPQRRLGQSVAYFSDLMRSATPDPQRLFWVTELQGGPTFYSAGTALAPSREMIRLWMWEGIGAGAKAIVFWCFNSRNNGYEAGEWSLLNQLDQPSPRLFGVQDVVSELKRHEQLYAETQPAHGKVAILYSEASHLLGSAEGKGKDPKDPRNENMYMDAMTGAYLLFSDLSVETAFLNEELLLQEDSLRGVHVLLLPNTIVLTAEQLFRIESFVKEGGVVVADGLCAMKDENGHLDRVALQAAASLFGAQVEDIETGLDAIVMTNHLVKQTGWFYRLPLKIDEETGAEPLYWFDDARPAVSIRKYGNGQAIRIGTNLFQSYFAGPDAETGKWLISLFQASLHDGIELNNTGKNLRMRTLSHAQGKLLVLFNYEASSTAAELHFSKEGILVHLGDGTEQLVKAGDTIRVPIREQYAEQLFFRSISTVDEQPLMS